MPGNNDRSERWTRGFVRVIGEGPTRERAYLIRRMIDGHRYEVSTKRSSEAGAILELLRFLKDPAVYAPTPTPDLLGDEGPAPVCLDAKLVEEYLAHCTKVGTTHQWLNSKRSILAWWMEKLRGIDLRRADLKLHIRAPLEGATSRQHRIATIKHLYTWLRDGAGKGILTAVEDHAPLGYGLALLRGAALRGGRQHRGFRPRSGRRPRSARTSRARSGRARGSRNRQAFRSPF